MPAARNLIASRSPALLHLFTKVRDRETSPKQFAYYAQRIMRILSEEAIACTGASPTVVQTPTGCTVEGAMIDESCICPVSIIRAGDSLLQAVWDCSPGLCVGKILIQRDEASVEKKPVLFYCKFPPDIASKKVLLCDPMLATGGSAITAIKLLVDKGVPPANITFLNVISCPEGIAAVFDVYPDITIYTGVVDEGLNEMKYIVPGLGDWGDRFYGTV